MKRNVHNWKYKEITCNAPSKNDTFGFDDETKKNKLKQRPMIVTTTKNHGPWMQAVSSTHNVVKSAAECLKIKTTKRKSGSKCVAFMWVRVPWSALTAQYSWSERFGEEQQRTVFHSWKKSSNEPERLLPRRQGESQLKDGNVRWKSAADESCEMHCSLCRLGISKSWRQSLGKCWNVVIAIIVCAPHVQPGRYI